MTVQDTERPAGPSGPDPARDAARAGTRQELGGLRPLLMRLHFYAGLLVGPFVLVAALTGLLYTVSPQLERAVHAHELTVPVGGAPVALSQQVAAAQRVLPEGTLIEVRPAATPDATTRVAFDAPGVREDYQRTAFVDPYTGEVRGVLDTFGEWLPARAWLDELHRTLLLGDVGRVYSELAASWLWVLAVSGVLIWTVRRRRDRRLRRLLLPETRPAGRGRLRSWHGAVGLWALAGMLLLSATGLTWSQFAGTNVSTLRSALNWTTPSVSTTLPPGAGAGAAGAGADAGADAGAGAGGDEAMTAERMLDVARASGMGGPVEIRPPGEPNGAWAVQQVQRHWPSQQDAVAIDPSTGTVVEQIRFADWPLAAKLARWGIDTHMGLLFGVVNQVLLAALALGICCMIVWAYRMWWLRRPTRGAVAGPPGAATRPGRGAVLFVGLVAIGVGVFLPVLGASLLIFLILDSIVVSRRPGLGALQGRPTPAGSAADDGQPSRRDSGGTVGRR